MYIHKCITIIIICYYYPRQEALGLSTHPDTTVGGAQVRAYDDRAQC